MSLVVPKLRPSPVKSLDPVSWK